MVKPTPAFKSMERALDGRLHELSFLNKRGDHGQEEFHGELQTGGKRAHPAPAALLTQVG